MPIQTLKKNSKQQITRKNILADEKEKSSELESFCDAGKKRFDECISKTLKQALKDVFNIDKTLEKNELKKLVKNISYPESSAELIKLTEKIIAGAFLLGFNHAGITLQKKDVNLADNVSYTSAVDPLPFEEAIGFLKSKVSIEKQVWDALEPKFRFRAFTVARLSECDHIEDVRKRLIQALEKGEGWQESWEEIESFTKNIRKPFLPGYWETVYRTNVQTAYTAGRLTQYASNPPRAWELLVIQDGRTTDICNNIASIAGNGKALKADHPFWTVYGFPPYHFNCRTTIRAVYDYEAGAGTDIVEPSIDEIKKDFMPQEGFGGNPIEKESWWKIPPNLIERADKYGITNDIIAQANELGMQSYFPELLQGYDIAYTGKNGGYVHVSKNWEYSEKEMQSAKRLADLGHTIYFLPRTYKTSSPDMIIDNEIGEMKHIITLDRKSIRNHIKRSGEQGAEIVYINIRSDKQKNRLFEIIKDEIKNIPMKSLLVDMNGNIERYERNFFTK
ncbi:phage minor head protein [Treponema phagedenis]|uniref:phage minor head protein n=1 Tax=Treponema phagedenis TaxID=162 RepID=UPI0020911F9A|nr:phage minor head protein [Treponema phagedenis]